MTRAHSMAERGRFELPVRDDRTPLFESGTLNHSDTSPYPSIVPEVYTGRMDATIKALRAVTAVYFRRLLRWALLLAAVFGVMLWALILYLGTNLSGWWLLPLVVILPFTIAVATIATGLWLLSGKLLPRQLTREETRLIQGFSDKLVGLTGAAKLPYPVALFLVAKDVLRRRESGFLRNAIDDSRTLKTDFIAIQDLFR